MPSGFFITALPLQARKIHVLLYYQNCFGNGYFMKFSVFGQQLKYYVTEWR